MIYGQAITFGVSGGGAPAIFGDGSDGVGLFTASTTWNAETEDTGMIVKNFESLTISEGVTISAGNRNCGMIVRVKGDCTIHGSLVNKMSPKTLLDSDGVDFSVYPASMLSSLAGDGGAGGRGSLDYSQATNHAYGGAGMTGRFYGGGWSGGGGGGCADYEYGAGSGGSSANITTAISAIFVGGAGGSRYGKGYAGTNGGGGGGSGTYASNNKGGTGGTGAGGLGTWNTSGSGNKSCGGGAGNYGGGVIILLVGGNLTLTGTIDCSGCTGGDSGQSGEYVFIGGSGGGGGGGRIFICHKGDISNSGTLNVNGGSGGNLLGKYYANAPVATAGTAGTAGTIAVKTYEQYKAEDVA